MKVNWYAANPGFHPVQPGYGLPWGTRDENIPRWVHQEAQRLAVEQLKSQSPLLPEVVPIMPEDRPVQPEMNAPSAVNEANHLSSINSDPALANLQSELPADWPDPRGFIPDGPQSQRPEFQPQHEPIISYMRRDF